MYSGKSGLCFTLILVLKAVLKYWTPYLLLPCLNVNRFKLGCPFAPLEFRLTGWQLKAIAPVNISTGQQEIKKNTVTFKAHGFHKFGDPGASLLYLTLYVQSGLTRLMQTHVGWTNECYNLNIQAFHSSFTLMLAKCRERRVKFALALFAFTFLYGKVWVEIILSLPTLLQSMNHCQHTDHLMYSCFLYLFSGTFSAFLYILILYMRSYLHFELDLSYQSSFKCAAWLCCFSGKQKCQKAEQLLSQRV